MIEFTVYDNVLGVDRIIYGYSFEDALKRANFDNSSERFTCCYSKYVD